MNDISQLVEMRVFYSIETYGDLTPEFLNKMRTELPVYFKDHLGRELTAYIAIDKGHIISTALLYIVTKPINPALPTGRTGLVLNVYTRPDYRRKGIAMTLVNTLLIDAKKLKLDYVELKATESGVPLYRRLGFKDEKSRTVPMIYSFESQ